MRSYKENFRYFRSKFGGVKPPYYFYHETRRDGERGEERVRDVARRRSNITPHHPTSQNIKLYKMKNKDLLFRKIERVESRLKSIEVSLTRPGVTLAEIRENIAVINEQLSDMRTMIERD